MTTSLWMLTPHTEATIDRISEDLETRESDRLQDLGFLKGEVVLCLKKLPFGGPGVYKVGDTVFSLGGEISRQIFMVDGSLKNV